MMVVFRGRKFPGLGKSLKGQRGILMEENDDMVMERMAYTSIIQVKKAVNLPINSFSPFKGLFSSTAKPGMKEQPLRSIK